MQAALAEAELRIRNLSGMMLLEEQRREECEQQLATASSDGRELHVKVRCAGCDGTTPLWGVHVHAAAVCFLDEAFVLLLHTPTAPVSFFSLYIGLIP